MKIMNYKNALLELIKSKEEISADKNISISLEEIANAWGKNVLCDDDMSAILRSPGFKYIDRQFLYDVVSALKKLEQEKIIKFRFLSTAQPRGKEGISISEITKMWSLEDRIFLEVKNGKDKNSSEKLSGKETANKEIVIDFQKGIYCPENSKLIYEIIGKRFKLVKYLCEKSVASLSDFVALTGQTDTILVTAINEINENFKNKLHLKKDLIIHSKTGGGYKLNREDFNIKMPKTFT